MLHIDEQACQQDAVQRINNWLCILEERIHALLCANDPESMRPAEREQAISRHLILVLRMLQLRQQYAEASPSPGEQALLDALLHGMDES